MDSRDAAMEQIEKGRKEVDYEDVTNGRCAGKSSSDRFGPHKSSARLGWAWLQGRAFLMYMDHRARTVSAGRQAYPRIRMEWVEGGCMGWIRGRVMLV